MKYQVDVQYITQAEFIRRLTGKSKTKLAKDARLTLAECGQILSFRFIGYKPQMRRLALALGLPVSAASSLQQLVHPMTGEPFAPFAQEASK